MEPSRPRGDGQRVVRQGEMVDADRLVAGRSQRRRRGLGHGDALGRAGQGGILDLALALGDPGHMGVAEERDPVGRIAAARAMVESSVASVWCGRP